MKSSVLLSAAAVAGFGVADANAVVVFSGSTYDVVASDPVPVGDGSEGLLSITVSLVNTTGNAALNPSIFDSTGAIGFSGQLHSEQFASGFPVATQNPSPTAADSANSSVDTHFLPDIGLVISAPTEALVDNGTSAEAGDFPSPNTFTGFAPSLTGVFEIANSATSVDIAQLVTTANVDFEFLISNTEGLGETASGVIPIPEPGSLALLASGGLLALRRRRA